MPNLTEQLKREGHLLTRSKPNGKAPKKRLPAMSEKRKKEAALYSKKRKAFLEAHRFCQAYSRICDWAYHNDRAMFMRMEWLSPRSEEIHHMKKPKQTYLLDESTWLAVSRFSHNWIEANKSTARKLGLLCY